MTNLINLPQNLSKDWSAIQSTCHRIYELTQHYPSAELIDSTLIAVPNEKNSTTSYQWQSKEDKEIQEISLYTVPTKTIEEYIVKHSKYSDRELAAFPVTHCEVFLEWELEKYIDEDGDNNDRYEVEGRMFLENGNTSDYENPRSELISVFYDTYLLEMEEEITELAYPEANWVIVYADVQPITTTITVFSIDYKSRPLTINQGQITKQSIFELTNAQKASDAIDDPIYPQLELEDWNIAQQAASKIFQSFGNRLFREFSQARNPRITNKNDRRLTFDSTSDRAIETDDFSEYEIVKAVSIYTMPTQFIDEYIEDKRLRYSQTEDFPQPFATYEAVYLAALNINWEEDGSGGNCYEIKQKQFLQDGKKPNDRCIRSFLMEDYLEDYLISENIVPEATHFTSMQLIVHANIQPVLTTITVLSIDYHSPKVVINKNRTI